MPCRQPFACTQGRVSFQAIDETGKRETYLREESAFQQGHRENQIMKPSDDALVYATGRGAMCPRCQRPRAECACSTLNALHNSDGIVRLARETKGRKGKGVTVITGLNLGDAALQELARELKQKCGAGGTVKEGHIEVQGEHRDALLVELRKRGFTVKKAGG
jgi:translation initiation factor 1